MRLLFLNLIGKIKQSSVLRKLLGPMYHIIHHDRSVDEVNKLRDNFKNNGLKVLETFDKIMSDNGFKYSLAFGTMLGAVREKGFIKHDADIDVFMWIEDYCPQLVECLKNNGFTFSHSFSVDNDKFGKEDTIMFDGVQIDIFYIYPPIEGGKYSYCCDFVVHPDCLSREHSVLKYGGLLPRRFEIPMSRDVVRIQFDSLSLPVLSNAKEFLTLRYGADYMTPNPKWVSGSNPYIKPWEDKVAVYK